MRTFSCLCGHSLYYEDSQCEQCGRCVGWCPECTDLSPLEAGAAEGQWYCARPECGALLELCFNYAEYAVCNRCVLAETDSHDDVGGSGAGSVHADEPGDERHFCDMCGWNDTIPDLSMPGKLEAWRRLEEAKRRALRQFRILKLPPYGRTEKAPPLSFDFKADSVPTKEGWRPMGRETVYTGHANGKITINVREADPVERERMRVSLGESFRTLVGHFRHELAHYLWDSLILGSEYEDGFNELFGDPNDPPYGEALKSYYETGAPADWSDHYISAYATMHPFEDWAETTAHFFHAYSVLETAYYHGYLEIPISADASKDLAERYISMGVFLNEVNRDLGLLDVVPSVFNPESREKLRFVRQVLVVGGEREVTKTP
ncbi:MAG: putative zinc-binding metallopeptidase [Verrucomicrobiota bacterium]